MAGSVLGWAQAAVPVLQQWYSADTGLWESTGWWNAANALIALIHYMQRTGDRSYLDLVGTTFQAGQSTHAGFIDNYYDDNGWWALTWIAAYDLTGDTTYLDTAKAIFTTNITGWDTVCRGGLWWNDSRAYKNAIPNELFLSLAAQLHQRVAGDSGASSYLDWALQEWQWFADSGMIDGIGLVNDGLTTDCANNGGVTWTYNQGVILGGLASLYQITGDAAYLRQAGKIADAAIANLVTPAGGTGPAGILREPCELQATGCDGDQTQFKGIFMRNLASLYEVGQQSAYADFIAANAASIWANDRNESNQFGLRWAGPFDAADASRQSSALDALNAAVAITVG
ncbi:MAG TPA: glycoside hydrolase family 76 protein [Streptosporangiaceae bacterium]|nr:glycoside hydrolase family 76 protein [Streptosporangiaceae bacterium]